MKRVHISIDDVGESLMRLPQGRSLFDVPMFDKLKKWHIQYGAEFTAYCYSEVYGVPITGIPDDYAKEFRECADWLKFGYHGTTSGRFSDESGYMDGFELVRQMISRLGMGSTNTLRLHYWHATPEQKAYLLSQGITTLLYPNDDTYKYDEDDAFTDEFGLTYWRTRVRYEELDAINDQTLAIGANNIVAFTHEWCFEEQSTKLEKSLEIFRKNGYFYIS